MTNSVPLVSGLTRAGLFRTTNAKAAVPLASGLTKAGLSRTTSVKVGVPPASGLSRLASPLKGSAKAAPLARTLQPAPVCVHILQIHARQEPTAYGYPDPRASHAPQADGLIELGSRPTISVRNVSRANGLTELVSRPKISVKNVPQANGLIELGSRSTISVRNVPRANGLTELGFPPETSAKTVAVLIHRTPRLDPPPVPILQPIAQQGLTALPRRHVSIVTRASGLTRLDSPLKSSAKAALRASGPTRLASPLKPSAEAVAPRGNGQINWVFTLIASASSAPRVHTLLRARSAANSFQPLARLAPTQWPQHRVSNALQGSGPISLGSPLAMNANPFALGGSGPTWVGSPLMSSAKAAVPRAGGPA